MENQKSFFPWGHGFEFYIPACINQKKVSLSVYSRFISHVMLLDHLLSMFVLIPSVYFHV